jgi:hypothetical protein
MGITPKRSGRVSIAGPGLFFKKTIRIPGGLLNAGDGGYLPARHMILPPRSP